MPMNNVDYFLQPGSGGINLCQLMCQGDKLVSLRAIYT